MRCQIIVLAQFSFGHVISHFWISHFTHCFHESQGEAHAIFIHTPSAIHHFPVEVIFTFLLVGIDRCHHAAAQLHVAAEFLDVESLFAVYRHQVLFWCHDVKHLAAIWVATEIPQKVIRTRTFESVDFWL